MSEKIDFELVASLALEIGDRFKLITEYFPNDNEDLLKNLAAASIHTALFIRDLSDYHDGRKTNLGKEEEQFLNECGCKNENE